MSEPAPVKVEHSDHGIVSFVLGLLAIPVWYCFFYDSTGGVFIASLPHHPVMMCCICGPFLINFVGIVLGFIDIFQRNKKQLFPALGILLNAGVLIFLFISFTRGMF
jgi:hypothetical protein